MEENGVVVQSDENGMEVEPRSPTTTISISKGDEELGKMSSAKKRQRKEPVTPTVERPFRERKSVDRFIISTEKEVKEFKVEKGSGTALKDIPNVVYKLSKRKASDEIVQLLHRILYGRQGKSHLAKTHILQFSGFVRGLNEEKEKLKVKEKLEKCVKENLIQISELLDLNLFKSSKKEDAVTKLLEFLESPHKTSDKSLEEKEKAAKLKKAKKKLKKVKKTKTSGQTPQKKKKTVEKESDDVNDDADDDEGADADEISSEAEVESEDKSDDEDYSVKSAGSRKRGRQAAIKPSKEDNEEDDDVDEDEACVGAGESNKEEVDPIESACKGEEEKQLGESKDDVNEEDSKTNQEDVNKQDVDDDMAEAEIEEKSDEEKLTKPDSRKPNEVEEKQDDDEMGEADDNKNDDEYNSTKSKSGKKPNKQEIANKVKRTPKKQNSSGKDHSDVAESKEDKSTKPESSRKANKPVGDKENATPPKTKTAKKQESSSAKKSAQKPVKETKLKKQKTEEPKQPNDAELHVAIANILQHADFSKVTFTDVLRQLSEHFKVDFSSNKAHVKSLIQQEIAKLVSAEESDEEEEEEEEEEKADAVEDKGDKADEIGTVVDMDKKKEMDHKHQHDVAKPNVDASSGVEREDSN